MSLEWFATSWLNEVMIGNAYMFPLFEILHFMGLCLLLGALSVVDLRLLGVARGLSIVATEKFVNWAFLGFGVNLITGIGFFFGDPYRYYPNLAFRIKVILILLAGANLIWYRFTISKKLDQLGDRFAPDTLAKTIAMFSITLWVGVIFFGRWIPYLE